MTTGSHAECSPSILARRLACPGSLEAEQGLPETVSAAAEEGTLAHEILSKMLSGGYAPLESFTRGIDVKYPDMLRAVAVAVDWVGSYVSKKYSVFSEFDVDPGCMFGHDDVYGTTDILMYKEDHLIVADYKHGRGTYVEVKDNPQLLAYAAGALSLIPTDGAKIERFTLAIIQPRGQHGGDPVRLAHYTYDEIRTQWDLIREKLARKDKFRRSGDHCKFCKARYNCMQRLDDYATDVSAMKHVADKYETMITGVGSAEEIPDAEVAEIITTMTKLLWLHEDMKKEAERRIKNGARIPGYKMVRGRGRRKWLLEETELIKKFKGMKIKQDEYFTTKLKSPSGIENLPKLTDRQRSNLENMYCMEPGTPVLAPDSDPKEAIRFDSTQAFSEDLPGPVTVTFI